MRKLTLLVAVLMTATLSFAQQGNMSFELTDFNLESPMDQDANLGYFMTDDILVSLGMSNWDNFTVGARYYTDFCGDMFVEATTTATGNEVDGSEYAIGAAIGWSKSLGIWKLQFEPKIVLDDIQDFTPRLAWGLRFNL